MRTPTYLATDPLSEPEDARSLYPTAAEAWSHLAGTLTDPAWRGEDDPEQVLGLVAQMLACKVPDSMQGWSVTRFLHTQGVDKPIFPSGPHYRVSRDGLRGPAWASLVAAVLDAGLEGCGHDGAYLMASMESGTVPDFLAPDNPLSKAWVDGIVQDADGGVAVFADGVHLDLTFATSVAITRTP